jgi:hypothetical protein
MATGSIAQGLFSAAPINSRITNNAAQCFVLGLPPRRDVGYVTKPTAFTLYLWNGLQADAVLTDISGDADASGISWGIIPPLAVLARQSLRVDINIAAEGPLSFAAALTFVSSCNTIILAITGTRAPALSGDVGFLLFPHNWQAGFDESLAWKTDVMIAHDRTEQRVQLRTMPRRTFDLCLVVAGAERRRLETWLTMRRTRYLFTPIWRDAVQLVAPIAEGESMITIANGSDNYVVGTPIAIWSDPDHKEIRTISGVGSNFLDIDPPFTVSWPVGTMFAPCRYCVSLEQRQVSRFTDDVGEYRLRLLVTGDLWQPTDESINDYRNLPVCPMVPNWQDVAESFDNKWLCLDNDTGMVEFDIQSIEPVLSREVQFLIIGRDRINMFLKFISERAGRLAPFWLAADDRGFELSAAAAEGDSFIVIEPIDYDYTLKDSPARMHIEMITTGGTVIRRKITGVETLPSGKEKLTLNAALPMDISAATLNRCAWLELVRLDSDEINLHWVAYDCLEVKLPIMVLP